MVTSAQNASLPASAWGDRHKIAPESWALALICLLDLGTTLFWVSYREAAEGNPLMSFYLERFGTYAFIGAKFVLFVMPLLIAEWARRSRPEFVRRALRIGVIGYLLIYGIGVARVNQADADTSQELFALAPILTQGQAIVRHRPIHLKGSSTLEPPRAPRPVIALP